MKPGDIYYIGSMGAAHNYCGWPVLIISVDDKHKTCHGLINGSVRWYQQKSLKECHENR